MKTTKKKSVANKLSDLSIGRTAVIEAVGGDGALRQHFLDMGVIPGVCITAVKKAPLGDPVEYCIHGYELTLRIEDASKIGIREMPREEDKLSDDCATCPFSCTNSVGTGSEGERRQPSEHPGLGEGGKFHPKGTGDPLPDDTVLKFALVGNQNSGKTTLFNQLTGSNQHVGNFPGVTVDRKDGVIKGHPNTRITDLPGIYSMSPYSSEEIVSRNFVLKEKPHAIINIVDATNIERNLYLTMQLLEMEIPVVVALNMMDELAANGGTIDVNEMESQLGTPVVAISAVKNQGVDELIDHAIHIAKYQEKPTRTDFCDESDHGGAVHRCIHAVAHLIHDHAIEAGLPWRFSATKVIEGDEAVIKDLCLVQNELETMEHIVLQMEQERGLDRSAAIADMRYSFIQKAEGQQRAGQEQQDRQCSHRQIQRYSGIHRNNGTCLLADFQCGRSIPSGPAGKRHRGSYRCSGRRAERCGSRRCGARPHNRRNISGRRKRSELHPYNHYLVLLPVIDGRLGIYRQSSICNG